MDEVIYKLDPEAEVKDKGTENSSDPAVPEEPPTSPTPSFRKPASPPPPPPRPEAGPSWEANWQDLDLSARDFPEAPFKRIHDELAELQTQYYRMEHITRGANRALDNCGPGNILRELAKRADRKEIERLETEKAQLGGTCDRHDSGAESKERRDPEVPRGAGGGLQQDPGVGGASGRGHQ